MSKPDVDTSWATDSYLQPVLDKNGNVDMVLNKREPPVTYKLSGVAATTPAIRGYINYKLNADHLMIEWLREGEVGRIMEFDASNGINVTYMNENYGGTWQLAGTDTKAGITTNVFRKIT